MANLTITVPDANVSRVQAAFGHWAESTWVPATNAEVKDAITAMLRQRVREYERELAATQARDQVQDAL